MELTFGQKISELRKQAGLSQKELAERLLKEDGVAISAQYLNDIEHGRRNPPSAYIITQMAKILNINADVLLIAAGTVPADMQKKALNQPEEVHAALQAFRRTQKK